jgi:hypothetical protein
MIDISITKKYDKWNGDPSDIFGFEISEGYFDFSIPFIPEHSKQYYLVVVSYTNGDSCGTYPRRLDYVMLYETLEKAEKTQDDIIEHNKIYKMDKVKVPSLKITLENNESMTCACYWQGYFERLEFVEIIPLKLNPSRPRRMYA